MLEIVKEIKSTEKEEEILSANSIASNSNHIVTE